MLNASQSKLVDKDGHISFDWLLQFNKKLEWVTPPATAASPGTQGQIAYDGTHIYVCISKNSWARVGTAAW